VSLVLFKISLGLDHERAALVNISEKKSTSRNRPSGEICFFDTKQDIWRSSRCKQVGTRPGGYCDMRDNYSRAGTGSRVTGSLGQW